MADRHMEGTLGIDAPVTELEAIDPGAEDGLFWARFHRGVMERATAELARRRDLVGVTIADALSGWARMVVPMAAAAAAVAAVALFQSPEASSPERLVDVLDVPSTLDEDLEGELMPSLSATAIAESF